MLDCPIDYESHPSLHSANVASPVLLLFPAAYAFNDADSSSMDHSLSIKHQIGVGIILFIHHAGSSVPVCHHLHICGHAKSRVSFLVPLYRLTTGLPWLSHDCEVKTTLHETPSICFLPRPPHTPGSCRPHSLPLQKHHQNDREGPIERQALPKHQATMPHLVTRLGF